jgi:glycosyltransferase involved in cell wall biosynthesis
VSDEDKKRLFDGCDTFVFPSRGEGFGIPVLEAMAAGKPVIASRLSVFEEVVGDCIQYFDMEGSVEEQAQALCRVMRHELDADVTAYEQVLSRYCPKPLGEAFGRKLLNCR